MYDGNNKVPCTTVVIDLDSIVYRFQSTTLLDPWFELHIGGGECQKPQLVHSRSGTTYVCVKFERYSQTHLCSTWHDTREAAMKNITSDTFSAYDEDRDGFLEFKELRAYLKHLRVTATSTVNEILIRRGKITFEEFIKSNISPKLTFFIHDPIQL